MKIDKIFFWKKYFTIARILTKAISIARKHLQKKNLIEELYFDIQTQNFVQLKKIQKKNLPLRNL